MIKNLERIGGAKKTRQNKYGLRRTHIKIDDSLLAGSLFIYLSRLIDPAIGNEDYGLATKDIAQAHEAVIRTVATYIRVTEEHYHNKERI